MCESFSGGTPSTAKAEYYGGDIPFIRSGEIGLGKTELFITLEGLENSSAKIIHKGEVLYALYGANSGDVALSRQSGAINQAILCLRNPENSCFLYQALLQRQQEIISTYIQGGQGNLSGEIIRSIRLFFPSLPEQQKISECLSSLDDLITATLEKAEQLKSYKKGLMQKLFPREGETIPRLRFPEFRTAPAWEEKKLNRVLKESRQFTPENNPMKRITVKLNLAGIEVREFRGTESDGATRYFIRKKGQFIYGKQNIHKGAFGIIPDSLDGFGTSQDLPAFDFQKGYSDKYLFYILSRESYYAGLEFKMTGTGSKRLGVSVFLDIKLAFPALLEQQKIAECLSSLDDLTAATLEKVEQLKVYKKGLMQELFPV